MKKSAQSGIVHILLLVGLVVIGAIGGYLYITKQLDPNKLQKGFPTNAASSTDTSYNLGVLVIKYFPLTGGNVGVGATGEQRIDINVTGDVGDLYTTIKQRTVSVTDNLKAALERGSRYLGYKDSNAQPSLTYQVVDTKEYTEAVPMLSDGSRRPNYNLIMSTHNICDYVDNKNVREVWLWAYQGPTYPGTNAPYLAISESKMAGPFGDISNSYRLNDMPICSKSYRVYTFNYGRGTPEALESWGHQLEAEISAVDNNLFRSLWQGPNYPQALGVNGRCGSVHNPPNARSEYDRGNPTPQKSDCLDWTPDSLGQLTDISCSNWGCFGSTDNNNPSLNYMVWNWQNMPGRGNTKTYQGKALRNWWDVHGNFDVVMGSDKTLTLSSTSPTSSPIGIGTTTPAPILTPTPIPTPTPDTVAPAVSITNPANNSTIQGSVNIKASASDNEGVERVEFYVDQNFIGVGSSTAYQLTWNSLSVENGTHQIQAQAFDKAGNNGSTEISVNVNNPDIQSPSRPSNLTAQAPSYNRVNLSWISSTDNIGVTGYWIIRDGITIAQSGTASYSDITVNPKTTYSYQVVAYDAAGNNSSASNTALVATPDVPDTQAPTAPTNLTATTVSRSQVNLSWNPSTDNVGVISYEILRDGSKIGNSTTTSFGDTGLNSNTTYTYQVRALDQAGNISIFSNTTQAKTYPLSQIGTGNILGVVYDSSGKTIWGAKITLTVNRKNKSYTSDYWGNYLINDLPPGTYNVSYRKEKLQSKNITVTVTKDSTTLQNVILQNR